MIQEARKNCAAKNVRNVDFVTSDDDLKLITGSFDLVHSYNVLQHIPIGRGLVLTDRLLSLVKPGGVAVLHYSLHRTLSVAKACAYAMKHHVPFGRVAMNLLQARKWDTPAMQMNNYSLANILAVFEKRDMENFVVVRNSAPAFSADICAPDKASAIFSARFPTHEFRFRGRASNFAIAASMPMRSASTASTAWAIGMSTALRWRDRPARRGEDALGELPVRPRGGDLLAAPQREAEGEIARLVRGAGRAPDRPGRRGRRASRVGAISAAEA